MRFAQIALVSMLLLTMGLRANADEKYERARVNIVSEYFKESAPSINGLLGAKDQAEAFTHANEVTYKTDAAFTRLEKLNLIDNKLGVYQNHWSSLLKPALTSNPSDATTATKVGLFRSEISKAVKDGNCTIVITASKGEGATIHYSKAHDADLGRAYRQLPGTTTIIHELERAEYRFKSVRNNMETGKSEIVACIDAKTAVKLVINE